MSKTFKLEIVMDAEDMDDFVGAVIVLSDADFRQHITEVVE